MYCKTFKNCYLGFGLYPVLATWHIRSREITEKRKTASSKPSFFERMIQVASTRIGLERWYTARYPLAMLVRYVINVLYALEQRPICSMDLKEKQRLLSGLEVVARCLEWHLPHQLSGGDVITDTWWIERMREVANAERDKKRWILTPLVDTQDWLTRSLASTLVCVTTGDWDGLERIKYQDIAHPHVWRSRLLHILAMLIEVALPILLFLIIRHFITLSTLVESYIVLGLFFWALITIIGSLDPNFSDKVAAIKDVTSIFPFPK